MAASRRVDEADVRQLLGLLGAKALTSAREREALIGRVKRAAKADERALEEAVSLAVERLAAPHAQTRLNLFRLLHELFMRSRRARELTLERLNSVCELAVGTQMRRPLPGPPAVARELRTFALRCIEEWHDAFCEGADYEPLRLCVHYLKNVLRMPFPSSDDADATRRRRLAAGRVLLAKFRRLRREFEARAGEAERLLREANTCLEVIAPRDFDAFAARAAAAAAPAKRRRTEAAAAPPSSSSSSALGPAPAPALAPEPAPAPVKSEAAEPAFDWERVLARAHELAVEAEAKLAESASADELLPPPLEAEAEAAVKEESDTLEDAIGRYGLGTRGYTLTVRVGAGAAELGLPGELVDVRDTLRRVARRLREEVAPLVAEWMDTLTRVRFDEPLLYASEQDLRRGARAEAVGREQRFDRAEQERLLKRCIDLRRQLLDAVSRAARAE